MSDYFGHLDRLWLLLLIPLVWGFFRWAEDRKRRDLSRFARAEVLDRLIASVDRPRRRTKRVLFLMGLALVVVSLAQPRFGTRLETVERTGVDIIVALDTSLSMMAEDVKPSRLERAKLEIRGLIERLRGDRIGLVAFAGDAFLVCPLTLDYSAARLFLSDMDTQTIGTPGTNLARAIDVARQGFVEEEQQYKVLILVTDGEDHSGEAAAMAERAAAAGVRIYAIGLGDPAGVPIPLRDASGRIVDYKASAEGAKVNSRLDELTLQRIAGLARGKYFRASSGQMELDLIYEEIKSMEGREVEARQITHYEERFQPFVAAALLFLFLESILSDRARVRAEWKGRFAT